MGNITIENEPVIFTTGAFLKPVKGSINGRECWMWVVTEFKQKVVPHAKRTTTIYS